MIPEIEAFQHWKVWIDDSPDILKIKEKSHFDAEIQTLSKTF